MRAKTLLISAPAEVAGVIAAAYDEPVGVASSCAVAARVGRWETQSDLPGGVERQVVLLRGEGVEAR